VEATVENKTLKRIQNVELTAIIFDSGGNAIASSRTFVETLEKGEVAQVFFTWPMPFETKSEVCATPVDVVLVVDRSGSMRSLGVNPPQPLTDVKNAAISFVNELSPNDQGALVSFATEATNPINFSLSSNFEKLKEAVNGIDIFSNGIQQTNIGDGLLKAREELNSPRHKGDSSKVMVVLTDGVATHPQDPADTQYPEKYAQEVALGARSDGISIFTIGLGNEINANFLKSIASSTSEFYLAPSARELGQIYGEIATKICRKRPAVIEILTRILP
jgi:Mg-chelatase subunit ChlD